MIQKSIVRQLVNIAISRLKSLPDGTECTRLELLFPNIETVWGMLSHYPFRTILYLIVDKSRLLDSFWKRLIVEDYIEDDSQVAGCFGGPYTCKYRKKSKLLNDFSIIGETSKYSGDNEYTYYVREMYEERNGKQKPLMLYRIPEHSSTGKIYCSSFPSLRWISIIVLKGKCLVIDSDILSCLEEEGESPEYECRENESTFFRGYSSDKENDWFELLNETNKELLVLIEPIVEDLL